MRVHVQVRDWFSKVDGARMVAKRPPPSYMRMGGEGQGGPGGQAEEDVPSLDEMQLYDSNELQLPDVRKEEPDAGGAPPHHVFNWTALQEDIAPVS